MRGFSASRDWCVNRAVDEQNKLPTKVIDAHKLLSEVIDNHMLPSEVIDAHMFPSEVTYCLVGQMNTCQMMSVGNMACHVQASRPSAVTYCIFLGY